MFTVFILDRVTEIFIYLTLFITICIEVYFYADDDEAIWIRLAQKWYCTKVRFMRWLMACCSWSLVSCLYPTDGTAVTGALLGIIGSSLSDQAASVAHRAQRCVWFLSNLSLTFQFDQFDFSKHCLVF